MSWYIIMLIVMLGVMVGMEFWFEKKEQELESIIRRQQKKINKQRAMSEKQDAIIQSLKLHLDKQNKTIIWLTESRQKEEENTNI